MIYRSIKAHLSRISRAKC